MSALQDATIAGRPRTAEQAPSPVARIDGNHQHRLSWMLRVPTPIIAAINGAMAGVGLSIALYCDFRYMVDNAKLTTAFARRGVSM
jgi:enoyl-CoA hydratase/carnithine racemase